MYSRLKLARNLLSDEGVIFISIDDNEIENLKKICNEIFGESNFKSLFYWKSRTSQNYSDKYISNIGEYILCYSKNYNFTKEFGKDKKVLQQIIKIRIMIQMGHGYLQELFVMMVEENMKSFHQLGRNIMKLGYILKKILIVYIMKEKFGGEKMGMLNLGKKLFKRLGWKSLHFF